MAILISKKVLYIFFSLLYLSPVNGAGIDIFTPQTQTPDGLIINTISKPEIFSTSNEMTRIVGSFNVAVGELLYLKGTLTDAFGVPIEGATIRIWQTNSSGRYQSLLKPNSEYIDKNFIMSGTARTDNIGRYGFKTIFPGFPEGRAPHINIIIYHPKFGEVQTEVYFENHPLNVKDPLYMSYPESSRKMLTAKVLNIDDVEPSQGKIAIFNVVLDGIHAYKGY